MLPILKIKRVNILMYFQSINKNFLKAAIIAAFFCLFFSVTADAKLPEHIAVLPIKGKGKPEDLKELRLTFFNHIGSKNYRDMELEDIDSKLFLMEQQSGKKWREFTNKELAEALGVQGLIFLDVVGIEKIYAGFFGSLTVKLGVEFVDADTGQILWKKEEQVSRKAGSIPLSPWAAISSAVQSAMVLRDSVKIELFDKLCRNVAKAIPEPPSLVAERPPTIFSVQTNALDSPFKAQEEILVSLKGDEGMKAYFNIVGQTDAITLNEMKPGLYLGKYVTTEGTNFKGQLMEVFLVNSEKRKVSKYQVPYLITVDTTPPGEPVNFQTGLSENGFKLSWEKPDADDIKEYVIKKAVVGQSEYEELAATELNEYIDESVSFGQKVFYRVFTKDFADNLSKAAEISRVAVKPGPTDVTGEIKEDTIFYSYGSPYIVRGQLTVVKGVKLTVEPGSVIRFEDGASLVVNGTIETLGTKEEGITFKGKGYNLTLADTGAGGGKFTHTFFRGGGLFEIGNSEASFDDCRMESFEIGLKAFQGSVINVARSFFGYNKTALMGDTCTISLDEVEFSHNQEGMSFQSNVDAKIGNIVLDANEQNITTESEIFVDHAEIPEKESFEILRSFRGPVDIANVMPSRKSLKALKEDSGNDLIDKIGDSLIEENFEETLKLMVLLRELFEDKYEKTKAIEGYALFKMGAQKEAKELITGSSAPYADRLAGTLGLVESSAPASKVRFVRVKIPVFGSGEGISKIALSKAGKQSVKDHVEGVTGRLERKKSFVVKAKILSKPDKYTMGVYPVNTKVTGSKFEGLYLVFLDTHTVLADLQDLRIIGNKRRELRVGLTSCGDGDTSRPELSRELNTLLFPVIEIPSKGCSFVGYKEDIVLNNLDMLVIVKETASASKSRVSNNLKMISADMDIIVFDAKTGQQVFDNSKGVVVYHMNESMGTKAAMKQAYNEIGQGVLDKLVAVDRKRSPVAAVNVAQIEQPVGTLAKPSTDKREAKASTAKAPAKKPEKAPAKKTAPEPEKGIVLSVAGVEPVFANMPEAFINRPFMTLVIENESRENIRKSELTLDVPGYFPAPIGADLESIPALDRVRLQLFAEFTDDLKKINRTKKAEAVISIEYGKKKTEIKYPVVIFDAHTTRWNTGDKLAIYIDDEDPSVMSIAEGIVSEASRLTDDNQLKKLFIGMVTLDYLSGLGVEYKQDAKRPFTQVFGSNTKVDSVFFPSEFLLRKAGDADDMLAATGSILKAAGVDMAFTVLDGKVFAMFDTAIPEELMAKYGFNKDQVVIYDENIWFPFDITAVKDGIEKSWAGGAKAAASMDDDTKLTVLSKAIGKYAPLRSFRQSVKVIPVSTFQSRYDELKGMVIK